MSDDGVFAFMGCFVLLIVAMIILALWLTLTTEM
jgi:hypothetical protein